MAQSSLPGGFAASDPKVSVVGGPQQLASLTPRSAREVFEGLSAPAPDEMAGRWDGQMVGRWWVCWANRLSAAPTPLRGWCGKQFEPSGQVTNLVRRRGRIRPSVRCRASAGTSLVDGRPALVVDYTGSGPPPVAWLRGEIRWLAPATQVFGLLLVRPGGRTVAMFPFVMTHAGQP